MKPQAMTTAQALSMGVEHHRNGRLAEADSIYRQVLEQAPNHPDALHLRGLVALTTHQTDIAIDFFRRAIAIHAKNADYFTNLGNALRQKHQINESIAAYNEALKLNPNGAETHSNLGNSLMEIGRLDDAIAEYRRAIELKPDFVNAYANLGNALREKGEFGESIEVQRHALRLQPNFAEIYANLGATYRKSGQWAEAMEAYQRALQIKPAQPSAQSNLGELLMIQGRIEEAVGRFELATKLDPKNALFGSNYVFALYFDPRFGPGEILEKHREWAKQHAPVSTPMIRCGDRDANPDRRLRVGYVSPYIYNHVIAKNLLPLFLNRDRSQFETFFYVNTALSDAVTERFRGLSDGWCEIQRMSDEAVAQRIVEDRIDILLDLTLRMEHGRPGIFARKPAPVQVAFAGYPGTTGMSQIDYRLTDPYLDPAGEGDSFYAEKSVRLPHSFWCYDPKAMEVDAFGVGPLPAETNGFVTFGCLSNFHKMNAGCLNLWARTLAGIPKSRMIILAPSEGAREWVRERFAAGGVDAGRIEFVPRQGHAEYMRTYDRIDLGLDTIPYNGHTTNLDSLWMGVPVLTLIGQTVVGRAGFSQLSNLGLAHLAAKNADEFVALASSVAADIPALAALRRGLRDWMLHSPLTDAKGFAVGIEAAYRQMWRDWCAGAA